MTDREALRERVARLYIDKWGLSDYWLADAAIDLVMEEAARVCKTDIDSETDAYGRYFAAALRAYVTPSASGAS